MATFFQRRRSSSATSRERPHNHSPFRGEKSVATIFRSTSESTISHNHSHQITDMTFSTEEKKMKSSKKKKKKKLFRIPFKNSISRRKIKGKDSVVKEQTGRTHHLDSKGEVKDQKIGEEGRNEKEVGRIRGEEDRYIDKERRDQGEYDFKTRRRKIQHSEDKRDNVGESDHSISSTISDTSSSSSLALPTSKVIPNNALKKEDLLSLSLSMSSEMIGVEYPVHREFGHVLDQLKQLKPHAPVEGEYKNSRNNRAVDSHQNVTTENTNFILNGTKKSDNNNNKHALGKDKEIGSDRRDNENIEDIQIRIKKLHTTNRLYQFAVENEHSAAKQDQSYNTEDIVDDDELDLDDDELQLSARSSTSVRQSSSTINSGGPFPADTQKVTHPSNQNDSKPQHPSDNEYHNNPHATALVNDNGNSNAEGELLTIKGISKQSQPYSKNKSQNNSNMNYAVPSKTRSRMNSFGTNSMTQEQEEQQHKPPDRRRNFAFMRQGSPSRKKISSAMLERNREHAKKLAKLVGSPPPTAVPSAIVDVHSGEASTRLDLQSHLEKGHQGLNFGVFDSDSVVSSFSTSSTAAYDMDSLDVPDDSSSLLSGMSGFSNPTPPRKNKNKLDYFVDNQRKQHHRDMIAPGHENVFHPINMKQRLSSKTFSSPSDVGSSNANYLSVNGLSRRKSQPQAGGQNRGHGTNNLSSNAHMLSSNTSNVGSSVSGAAARRLMRRSMHKVEYINNEMSNVVGENALNDNESQYSGFQDPLEKQAPIEFSNDINMQKRRPPLSPEPLMPKDGSGGTKKDLETGFTFDAFGLDANEIDEDVDAALAELAETNPDLYLFGNDEEDDEQQNTFGRVGSQSTGSTLSLTPTPSMSPSLQQQQSIGFHNNSLSARQEYLSPTVHSDNVNQLSNEHLHSGEKQSHSKQKYFMTGVSTENMQSTEDSETWNAMPLMRNRFQVASLPDISSGESDTNSDLFDENENDYNSDLGVASTTISEESEPEISPRDIVNVKEIKYQKKQKPVRVSQSDKLQQNRQISHTSMESLTIDEPFSPDLSVNNVSESPSQKRANEWAAERKSPIVINPLLVPKLMEITKAHSISQKRAKDWADEAPLSSSVKVYNSSNIDEQEKATTSNFGANTQSSQRLSLKTVSDRSTSFKSPSEPQKKLLNSVNLLDLPKKDNSQLSDRTINESRKEPLHLENLDDDRNSSLPSPSPMVLPENEKFQQTTSVLKKSPLHRPPLIPPNETITLRRTGSPTFNINPERFKSAAPSVSLRKVPPRPPKKEPLEPGNTSPFQLKLRKTPIPYEKEKNPNTALVDEESESSQDSYDSEGENVEPGQQNVEPDRNKAQVKKLTYKEKRDLLKKEEEAKQASHKHDINEPPERDIAALVRKRVAANKKKAAEIKDLLNKRCEPDEKKSEIFTSIRQNLRKTPTNNTSKSFGLREEGEVNSQDTVSLSRSWSHSTNDFENDPALQLHRKRQSEQNEKDQNEKEQNEKEQNEKEQNEKEQNEKEQNEKEQNEKYNADSKPAVSYHGVKPPKYLGSKSFESNTSSLTDEILCSNSSKSTIDSANADVSLKVPTENSASKNLSCIAEEMSAANGDLPSLSKQQMGGLPPPPGKDSISINFQNLQETEDEPLSEDEIESGGKVAKKENGKLMALFAQRSASMKKPNPSHDEVPELPKVEEKHLDTEIILHQDSGGSPALKDDPKYAKYFKMLKIGMPMEMVKHAMTRDELDPTVMDGDHKKPVGEGESGVPLKNDPRYEKYFKMLKLGLPMGAVKNAMERDGEDPTVMDGDHNAPALAKKTIEPRKPEPLPKDNFRRTRLHWDTLGKVLSTSLWAMVNKDPDVEKIVIDENEFAELFQAKVDSKGLSSKMDTNSGKKRNAVKVIDPKRANNGGIILARLKLTYDEMAVAVDKIDETVMTAEQIQGLIEYIPTKEEKQALRKYMTSSKNDSASLFDELCECEKFMVAMMTVKHSKEKVRATLFKLQFQQCVQDLEREALVVQQACEELLSSARLRKILGIVLTVGNRLNTAGYSRKGKAGAFTIKSLLKLNQAKAFDKKTTFLHYVVMVVQRHDETLSCFKDDLPSVLKASKIYWDQCMSDLEEVETQLENVRKIALHEVYGKKKAPWMKRKKKGFEEEEMSHASMTLEEEVEALRATSIGLFTLDAIKTVSSLRENVEQTNIKYAKILEYFGEEERNKTPPHELFGIIVKFSKDFDIAKEEVLKEMNLKKRGDVTRLEKENKKKESNNKNKKSNSRSSKSNWRDTPKRTLRLSSMQPSMKSTRPFNVSAEKEPSETQIKEKNENGSMNQLTKEFTANEDYLNHDSSSFAESRQNSHTENFQIRLDESIGRQDAFDGMKDNRILALNHMNQGNISNHISISEHDPLHIQTESSIACSSENGSTLFSAKSNSNHTPPSPMDPILSPNNMGNVLGKQRIQRKTPEGEIKITEKTITSPKQRASPEGDVKNAEARIQSSDQQGRNRRLMMQRKRHSISSPPTIPLTIADKNEANEYGKNGDLVVETGATLRSNRAVKPCPENMMSRRERTSARREKIARRNGARQSV